jgi:hypothetical protein
VLARLLFIQNIQIVRVIPLIHWHDSEIEILEVSEPGQYPDDARAETRHPNLNLLEVEESKILNSLFQQQTIIYWVVCLIDTSMTALAYELYIRD